MATDTRPYPFTAIVGMDDLGLALCLSAVSPSIGGVLVRGEKGTAKSTMVRALAAVLPPVEVVEGCRFSCDPGEPDPHCPDGPHSLGGEHPWGPSPDRPVRLVELPLGASEDRVVGSLHLDRLVSQGKVAFEPGLLAQAHRGILYVDEVNLLPDHLVDTLLDAAAMGRARVEREAVSVTHAARFVLVGTMNPEEGDLRPQLLDRFGLAVDVRADREPSQRVEVMRRRLAYEADPAAFAGDYADADSAVAQRISDAQERLPKIALPDEMLVAIATLCAAYDIDGMRGDLVVARAAVAHAAWRGSDVVGGEDVRVAARLALPHRLRRNPFDTSDGGGESLDDLLDQHVPDDGPQGPDDPDAGPDGPGGGERETPDLVDDASDDAEQDEKGPATEADAGSLHNRTTGERASDPYAARLLRVDRAGRGVAGRRSTAVTHVGRQVRAVGPEDPRGRGLALTDTVRRAAQRTAGSTDRGIPPLQGAQDYPDPGEGGSPYLRIAGSDLRRSLRQGREGNLVVFAVDTSGSMGAARRIREVKTAVVSLLLDAYQRRDRVAVVAFAGGEARVVLAPTSSVDRAERLLAHVPTGGRTPLAEGLMCVAELVRREEARDPMRRPLLVLLTDGRATHGARAFPRALEAAKAISVRGWTWVVVDCETGSSFVRLGLGGEVARGLGAELIGLDEVAAASLGGLVRKRGVA